MGFRRFILVACLWATALLCHARDERHRNSNRHFDAPIILSNFVLHTNETAGDLVIIGGHADIRGTVEGSLVVVGGKATISGTVEHQTVLVLGGVNLAETARLEGETVMVGGPFNIAPGAHIENGAAQVDLGDVQAKVDGFTRWLLHGPVWGRLLTLDTVWPWWVAGFAALTYLLSLLMFPAAVQSTLVALEERPVSSILIGMLVMVLAAPLSILLITTVIGIVAVPFLKLGLILLAVFGKTAVICLAGRGVSRNTGIAALAKPLPAFFFGLLLITIAYLTPVIGLLVWAAASILGLGAATIAVTGGLQKEGPAPVAVSAAALGFAPAPSALPLEPPPTPTGMVALPRAGFWIRVLASLLDLLLLCLLIPLLGKWFLLVAVAYFVAMWTWKGTTIGGLVLGLKLVRTNGLPLTFAVAFVRSLSSLFSILVGFLGFLWAAWDRDKQSWHDKIAGTVIVKMPKGSGML